MPAYTALLILDRALQISLDRILDETVVRSAVAYEINKSCYARKK